MMAAALSRSLSFGNDGLERSTAVAKARARLTYDSHKVMVK
jgi:hypothetical protein